jgi:hypothetical protein
LVSRLLTVCTSWLLDTHSYRFSIGLGTVESNQGV